MDRAARLLLAIAAAFAIAPGLAFTAMFHPIVLPYFAFPCALFALARGADRPRARMLAWSGACAMLGLAFWGFDPFRILILVGAAVGVIAAGSTVGARARAYSIVALVAWLALFFVPPLVLFAPWIAFGLAATLAYAGLRDIDVRAGFSPPPRSYGAAIAVGALAVAAEFAVAYLRPSSSVRYELSFVTPLVLIGLGGALLGLGVASLRGAGTTGIVASALGAAVLTYAFSSGPAADCLAGGRTTGPWWYPLTTGITSTGIVNMSMSGGSTPSGSYGEIRRGDGLTVHFECRASEMTAFELRR
jgi:hypothetical protein